MVAFIKKTLKKPELEEHRRYGEAILEAQGQAVKDDRDFLMLTRITEKLRELPRSTL